MTGDRTIIIDTPDLMAVYRLLSFRAMLKIEICTGMRHSQGSVLKAYNREYGTAFRTKRQALADAEDRVALAKLERGM